MSSFNVGRANLINEISQNVNQAVQIFSTMFTESAQSMEISVNYNSITYPKMWFDTECNNFKLLVRRSLHTYTNKRLNVKKDNYNTYLRKQNKDLINRNQTLFNERRASRFCDSITNSSSFCKEIKHIMNPPKNVCNKSLNEWLIISNIYFNVINLIHQSSKNPITLQTLIPVTNMYLH